MLLCGVMLSFVCSCYGLDESSYFLVPDCNMFFGKMEFEPSFASAMRELDEY